MPNNNSNNNFEKGMQPAIEAVARTNELLKELKSLVKEGNKTGLKELGQRIKSESTSAANDINAGAQELNNSAKTLTEAQKMINNLTKGKNISAPIENSANNVRVSTSKVVKNLEKAKTEMDKTLSSLRSSYHSVDLKKLMADMKPVDEKDIEGLTGIFKNLNPKSNKQDLKNFENQVYRYIKLKELYEKNNIAISKDDLKNMNVKQATEAVRSLEIARQAAIEVQKIETQYGDVLSEGGLSKTFKNDEELSKYVKKTTNNLFSILNNFASRYKSFCKSIIDNYEEVKNRVAKGEKVSESDLIPVSRANIISSSKGVNYVKKSTVDEKYYDPEQYIKKSTTKQSNRVQTLLDKVYVDFDNSGIEHTIKSEREKIELIGKLSNILKQENQTLEEYAESVNLNNGQLNYIKGLLEQDQYKNLFDSIQNYGVEKPETINVDTDSSEIENNAEKEKKVSSDTADAVVRDEQRKQDAKNKTRQIEKESQEEQEKSTKNVQRDSKTVDTDKIKKDVAEFTSSLKDIDGYDKTIEDQSYWIAEYIEQIQKGEISVSDAIDKFKERISKKITDAKQEIDNKASEINKSGDKATEGTETDSSDKGQKDKKSEELKKTDSSGLLSDDEIETASKLEEAIKQVEEAIKKKTEEIENEETQMKTSVDAEIDKLQALKDKLDEIKTEFQNGVISGLFKDTDGNDTTPTGDVTLNPKLSDTFNADTNNLLDNINIEKDVELKPTVDADKFKKDAETILAFVDVDKEVNFKAGELDTKLTPDNIDNVEDFKFDNDFAKSLFDNLVNDFKIESKEAQDKIRVLVNSLSTVSMEELSSGIENNNFLSIFDELTSTVIENANVIEQRTGIYDEFYKYLKGISSIKIPDIVKSDLGDDWNTLRQVYPQKFTTKKGTELDSIYQELASRFSDIFSGTSDQTEQFKEIVDAIRLYREDTNKIISATNSDVDESSQQILSRITEMRTQIKDYLNLPLEEKQLKGINDINDKGNENKIQLEPLIDQASWEAEIDRIIELIGTKHIKINPDTTSQEWNEFKTFIDDISNKVITLNLQYDKDTNDQVLNNAAISTVNASNTFTSSSTTVLDVDTGVKETEELDSAIDNLSDSYSGLRNEVTKTNQEIKKSEWDKVTDTLSDYGEEPLRTSRTKTRTTDSSVETVQENWIRKRDEEGNLIDEFELDSVKIINDYKKFEKDQKKLQEQILKNQSDFESKLEKYRKTFGTSQEYLDVESAIGRLGTTDDFEAEVNELKIAFNNLTKLEKEFNANVKKSGTLDPAKSAEIAFSQRDFDIDKLVLEYQKLGFTAEEAEEKVKKLRDIATNWGNIDRNLPTGVRKFGEYTKQYYEEQRNVANNISLEKGNAVISKRNEKQAQRDTTLELDVTNALNGLAKYEEEMRESGQLTDSLTNKLDDLLDKLVQVSNSGDLNNWTKEFRNLKNSVDELPLTSQEQSQRNTISQYDQLVDKINELRKSYQEYLKLNRQVVRNPNLNLDDQINYQKERIDLLTTELKETGGEDFLRFTTGKEDVLGTERVKEYTEAALEMSKAQELVNSKFGEANTNKINSMLRETESIMSNVFYSHQNVSGFDTVFDEAMEKVQLLNNALEHGMDTDTYEKQIRKIADELNSIVALNLQDTSLNTLKNTLDSYVSSIGGSKAEITSFDKETGKLNATFRDQNNNVLKARFQVDSYAKTMKIAKDETKETTTALGKFSNFIKGKFMNLGGYLASFGIFNTIWDQIRQGVTYIRDLDTALTEMKKVSDETTDSLKEFQKASFDIANTIGGTAKELSDSTADFMRLGYSLEEAGQLAQDANIYANVGDMEIDEATEHMVSSIKAWGSEFRNEVEASNAIIDRYNEIGNNFAISSADIGSAMERSGAALKAAGKILPVYIEICI